MSACSAHRPSSPAQTLPDGDTATSPAFRLIAGHAMPVLHRFEIAMPALVAHWRQYAGVDDTTVSRAARTADLIAQLAEQQRVLIAGHPELARLALRHATVGPTEPLAVLGCEPLADTPEADVNALVPLVLNPCYRVGLLMTAPAAWTFVQSGVVDGWLPDAVEPWGRLRDLHCHLLGCSIAEAEQSFLDLGLRLLGESPSDSCAGHPTSTDNQ